MYKKQIFQLLLLVIVVFIYANSIPNLYSIDDDFTIFKNSNVAKGIAGIPNILTQPYSDPDYGTSYGYRPIAAITFAIEHQAWGFNPHLSHALNLLIYYLSILVLLSFLVRLLPTYNRYFVYATVLLFAVHPIHTEVVDNLKSRDILLSFAFGIGSLYVMLGMLQSKKWSHLIFIIIAYLIACLAHPISLLFAGVWLAVVLHKYAPKELIRKDALIALSLIVLMVVLFKITDQYATYVSSTYKADSNFLWENPLYVFNDGAKMAGLALNCLLFYFKQLLLPYPLCYYYGYNQIPYQSWQNPMPLLSLAIYTIIALSSAVLLLKRHILGFILAIYFATIFPFSNLLQIGPGIVAERWAYLASVGSCLLMAYTIFKLTGNNIAQSGSSTSRTKIALSIVALIAIVYSGLVIARNPNWHDNLTLAGHDTPYLPNSAKANAFLAEELMRNYLAQTQPNAAQHTAIENLLLRTLSIDSTYAETWNNLGVMSFRKGDTTTAKTCYEQALNYKKPYYLAMSNLADIYNKKGDFATAAQLYTNYIGQDSSNLNAYLNLARFQSALNQLDKSVATNTTALGLFPKQKAIVYDNISIAYMEHAEYQKAIDNWLLALKEDPNNKNIIFKLSNAYKQIGNNTESLKYENSLN